MTEKSFKLKLSKKEVEVLDHGRFKGMVDILSILEKRINDKLNKGEKVETSTFVTEILGLKLQSSKMLNKTAENLSKYSDDSKEEAPAKK